MKKKKDRRVLLSPHIAHVDEILKKRKKKKAHVDTTNNVALSITFWVEKKVQFIFVSIYLFDT